MTSNTLDLGFKAFNEDSDDYFKQNSMGRKVKERFHDNCGKTIEIKGDYLHIKGSLLRLRKLKDHKICYIRIHNIIFIEEI